jgi:UDP-2,3-diacylglucosamine pyrophosphatase LpxH
MGLTRVVVLSDLHLAAGPLASVSNGEALAAFLGTLVPRETTLVLAGDVLDLLHAPDRPRLLDLTAAPALIAQTLHGIAGQEWGRRVLAAWSTFLREGGTCVVLPGNHDPELHHADAGQALLTGLGLDSRTALRVHRGESAWTTRIGERAVRIVHGHRVDPWNDIPADDLRQALAGRRDLPLPPGSRVVTDVLPAFKRLRTDDGRPRFAFVDLLKPELPAVVLLLLYLEPALARAQLQAAVGLTPAAVDRWLRFSLRSGPVLSSAAPPAPSDPSERLAATLAQAIAAELPPDLRAAPSRVAADWDALGARRSRAASLAAHDGLGRFLLRAALRALSDDGAFFDPTTLGADDEAVLAELDDSSGPLVLVRGHSHAAREHRRDGLTYINTGTWLDLLRLPQVDDDAAVRAWIDALEAGMAPRLTRLTYAEITPAGAHLREWR